MEVKIREKTGGEEERVGTAIIKGGTREKEVTRGASDVETIVEIGHVTEEADLAQEMNLVLTPDANGQENPPEINNLPEIIAIGTIREMIVTEIQ